MRVTAAADGSAGALHPRLVRGRWGKPPVRGKLGLYARRVTRVNRIQGWWAPMADHDERDLERRRKRALFLRELNEAKELRDRVQPRKARAARMRQQMRMRTFRW